MQDSLPSTAGCLPQGCVTAADWDERADWIAGTEAAAGMLDDVEAKTYRVGIPDALASPISKQLA